MKGLRDIGTFVGGGWEDFGGLEVWGFGGLG